MLASSPSASRAFGPPPLRTGLAGTELLRRSRPIARHAPPVARQDPMSPSRWPSWMRRRAPRPRATGLTVARLLGLQAPARVRRRRPPTARTKWRGVRRMMRPALTHQLAMCGLVRRVLRDLTPGPRLRRPRIRRGRSACVGACRCSRKLARRRMKPVNCCARAGVVAGPGARSRPPMPARSRRARSRRCAESGSSTSGGAQNGRTGGGGRGDAHRPGWRRRTLSRSAGFERALWR